MTEHNDNCPHCDEDISDVIAGLKSALDKTREEKREEHNKAATLKDELATAKVLLEDATLKLRDADHGTSEALQLEINALTEQLATMVSKSDFDAQTANLATTTTELNESLVRETQNKVIASINKAGGNVAMLTPMLEKELALNPELDTDARIQELRTDDGFRAAFKASDHSGSGADPGKGNDVTFGRSLSATTSLRRSTMTDRQKVDHQKQYGLDSLLSLPE